MTNIQIQKRKTFSLLFTSLLFTIATILLASLFSLTSFACNLKFNIVDANGNIISKKEQYKVDEEIILEITHKITHRNCTIPIEDTKIIEDGFKIISATNWKVDDKGTNSRKFKLKVLDNKTGTSVLSINRNCDRSKQIGSFSLAIAK